MRTYDISFQVIKVDVSPVGRFVINQSDLGVLTGEFCYVPSLTEHCLATVPCFFSDNLHVTTNIANSFKPLFRSMLTYLSWLNHTSIQIKSNLFLLKSRHYRTECADYNVQIKCARREFSQGNSKWAIYRAKIYLKSKNRTFSTLSFSGTPSFILMMI